MVAGFDPGLSGKTDISPYAEFLIPSATFLCSTSPLAFDIPTSRNLKNQCPLGFAFPMLN